MAFTSSAGYSRTSRNLRPRAQSIKQEDFNPFGPQMACEIFNVDFYDDDAESISEDWERNHSEEMIPSSTEYWYQLDLPLENVREIEERHRQEIKRFSRAYKQMCVHALKWHYLMEDLEDNVQLKKLFNDIQLMRKLGGSEGV